MSGLGGAGTSRPRVYRAIWARFISDLDGTMNE